MTIPSPPPLWRVQPHWDSRCAHAAAHPSMLASVHIEEGDGLTLTDTRDDAAPVSLHCGFIRADASLPPATLLLPLATVRVLGWPQGSRVRVQRAAGVQPPPRGARAAAAAAAMAAAAGNPIPPAAVRVQMQVWPPLMPLQRQASTSMHAASTVTAHSSRRSPSSTESQCELLSSLLHPQLTELSCRVLTAPESDAAGASDAPFLVLQWNGLACLARVRAIYAQDNDNGGSEAQEVRVSRALMAEHTQLEVQLVTQPHIVQRLDSCSSATSSLPTATPPPRPLFPHMRADPVTGAPSVGSCFPREWRALHLFAHNAMQAHGVAEAASAASAAAAVAMATHSGAHTSAAVPARQPNFGLAWGVPRALLLSGGAGTGKSRLLRQLEEQVRPDLICVRRVSSSQLLAEVLANHDADVLQQHYDALLAELAPSPPSSTGDAEPPSSADATQDSPVPRVGVLVFEDMDAVVCGNSYPRMGTQLLALLERISAPSRTSSSSFSSSGATPPLLLLMASVKNADAVHSHLLSSGRFDAHVRMSLLTKSQRADLLNQNIASSMRGQHVQLQLHGMPQPPKSALDDSDETALSSTAVTAVAAATTPSDALVAQLCSVLGGLTPGFIAADLSKLVQYALLHAARRWDAQQAASVSLQLAAPAPSTTETSTAADASPPSSPSRFELLWADFADALAHTHPSAQGAAQQAQLRFHAEDASEADSSTRAPAAAPDAWPMVGGYPLLKRRLALTLHHWLHPASVSVLGLRPISGVLFHGASGTGKSLWASSLARHASFNFLSLSVASLLSQWLGESEAKLRAAFAQAANLAPCVLLLDQLEAMAGKRDDAGGGGDGGGSGGGGAAGVDARILSTLLNELDGVGSRRAGVYVVACCRRLSMLDSALLRPGRFDDVIEVAMPDAHDREAILRMHAKGVAMAAEVDLSAVAKEAQGMTGADLRELLSRAGMQALREDVQAMCVQRSHLMRALQEMNGATLPSPTTQS